MHALRHGQETTVQYLLDKNASIGLDVHQKDSSGRSILFYRLGHVNALVRV